MRKRRQPGSQARGRRTREALLEAVLALLAEGGPRAVTHRAVAARAGVSPGVTTYHFRSAADMLQQAFALHLARMAERVRALSDATTARLRDGALDLPAVIDAGAALLRHEAIEGRRDSIASYEVGLYLARHAELPAPGEAGGTTNLELVAELVAGLGSDHPSEDAELLIACADGLLLRWLARSSDPAYGERVRALLARLLTRLWADPSS